MADNEQALQNDIDNFASMCMYDFEYFAKTCLSIKPKVGPLQNFEFNKAQIYLDKVVNDMIEKYGKVRVIIVKGRQQGLCLSPDTDITLADLTTVKLRDLEVGDQLLAVDEEPIGTTANGRKNTRRMRRAFVEATTKRKEEVFELVLSNGTVLKATANHRWLSRHTGSTYVIWKKVSDLKVGNELRAATIDSPSTELTHLDGWIGGVIDADGSCSTTGSPRIAFSQVEGRVLQKYKSYLDTQGIKYYELVDRRTKVGNYTKLGDKPVHCIRVDCFSDIARLIEKARPVKFEIKGLYENRKLSNTTEKFDAWPKIISIKSLGVSDVVDLQTSQKTFVANGIVSHNSTWVEARGYWKVCHEPGTKAFILTHEGEATKNLFNMAKRYHDNAPPDIRPVMQKSNQTEMTFNEMDCEYAIGTAKTGDSGRSQTIQFFHGSEVAYWRAAKEIASGCMEGIPEEPGTESYLESTAAGFGGYFHSMWQNGIYPGEEPHAKWNGYIRVFVPWIWQPEYRMKVFGEFERTDEEKEIIKLHGLDDEQLQWRRMKIAKMENDTARFQRDYPLTPEEAFNSAQDNVLISANLVIKARAKGQIQYYQPVGSVILGVDVARFGDDSTSFALRQGRVIFWTKRFNKLDSMAVTSEIIMILRQYKIDFVTVDGTGGYGAGVIDRLREMGYGSKVVEVNFSERALEDEKFKNKRSEIWAAVRDWLLAGAQLPNDDAIQHDLCSVTYKFDSAGDKLQLESKAEMKKRGIKSPDIGDAIALTFARPSLGLSGVNGRGESFDPDEYFG